MKPVSAPVTKTLKPGSRFGRVLRLYRSAAIIAFHTIVLATLALYTFDQITIGEWSFGRRRPIGGATTSAFIGQVMSRDPALRAKLFGQLARSDIGMLRASPGLVPHPFLPFMEKPTRSRYYNVGFENMRYGAGVDDSNARVKMNGSTWVFGGSTTFGTAVEENKTIPAFLKAIHPDKDFLNFGVQGYNQNIEIEKLILLLKKGYRPKRVIFIDGVNDFITLLKYKFPAAETSWRPYPMSWSEASGLNYRLFPYSALMRLRWMWSSPWKEDSKAVEDIYRPGPDNRYVEDPEAYSRAYQVPGPTTKDLEVEESKISDYLTANLELLRALAAGYRFDLYLFFQPLGFINRSNPFLDPAEVSSSDPLYQIRVELAKYVRNRMVRGDFKPFEDLSRLDEGCSDCYVDDVHYSPAFNNKIARAIASVIDKKELPGKRDASK